MINLLIGLIVYGLLITTFYCVIMAAYHTYLDRKAVKFFRELNDAQKNDIIKNLF